MTKKKAGAPDESGENKDTAEPVENEGESGTGGEEATTESTGADDLDAARAEIEAYKDRWLRAAAELDNFRRRIAREQQDQAIRAGERILRSVLDPLENLARGVRHAAATNTDPAFVQGMEMVHQQFLAVLERERVKPMDAVGQQFDPNLHEALMMVERDDLPPNTVVDEVDRGWFIGERVLRHAKVTVSRNSNPAPASGGDEGAQPAEE